jgi:hypothetical protein
MAHFLPSLPAEALAKVGMAQILLSITRVAVQSCQGVSQLSRCS